MKIHSILNELLSLAGKGARGSILAGVSSLLKYTLVKLPQVHEIKRTHNYKLQKIQITGQKLKNCLFSHTSKKSAFLVAVLWLLIDAQKGEKRSLVSSIHSKEPTRWWSFSSFTHVVVGLLVGLGWHSSVGGPSVKGEVLHWHIFGLKRGVKYV